MLAEACAAPASPSSARRATVLHPDRQQGAGDRRGQGGRRADPRQRRRRPTDVDELVGGGRGHAASRCSSRRSPAAAGAACAASTTPPACARRSRRLQREAEAAFGDPTVFLEQAVVDPRHIEVQILADAAGNVIHLFERDCSVQRRHQKVVEIAPAPNLDPDLRERMCADAVRFAERDRLPQRRHRRVPPRRGRPLRLHRDEPADPGRAHRDRGGHRRRPRASPDADRVRRDARRPRPEPGRRSRARRGAAVPHHHRGPRQRLPPRHRPDHRRTARPAAAGVRLDGGTVVRRRRGQRALRLDAGQAHLPRAHLPRWPCDRARRALAEFRIRGVVDQHPVPRRPCSTTPTSRPAGSRPRSSTTHPQLLDRPDRRRPRHQAAHLPRRRHRQPAARRRHRSSVDPRTKLPALDLDAPAPPAARGSCCCGLGPEEFARRCARAPTCRSPTPPSATPTRACSPPGCAPATCCTSPATSPGLTPELLSMEAWGGATYDVALRFLSEDPWERLAALREAMPNICLQMLLRGRNTVGYTPYPTEVTDAFVHEAAAHRHRHLPHLRLAQRRRADAPGRSRRCARPAPPSPRWRCATPATCSTRARSSTRSTTTCAWPSRSSTPARTCSPSRTWPACCAPRRRRTLVTALREQLRPAGAPAHPRHRRRPDRARCSPRSTPAWMPSTRPARRWPARPASRPVGAGRRHRRHRARDRPRHRRRSARSSPTGRRVRRIYAPVRVRAALPHRARLLPRDPRRPAVQPAPAGDRPRPRRQVRADRGHVRRRQPHPRQPRQGHPVVQGRRRPRPAPGRASAPTRPTSRTNPSSFDIPDSVIGFLDGELGDPPGGWPEPFRTKALAGPHAKPRATERYRRAARRPGAPTRARTLNQLLFPGPTKEFEERRDRFGDLSVLRPSTSSTACEQGEEYEVEIEAGKRLLLGLAGDRRAGRARHPHRHVHAQRPVPPDQVRDRRSPPTSRPSRRPTRPSPATSPRRSRAS